MKRFFLSFLMLLTLINWLPTHAEAQARTVSITGPEAANGEFDVTITFSGTVTDFVRTDITVIGGNSTGTLEGSGAEYTITIRPANVSKVRVNIQADVVDEGNSASNSLAVSIDRISPTVSITQPSRIQKMAFMTTITFSEDVTGFDMLTDVVLTGTAMSGTMISAINPISASVYEVTITPDINGMKGQLVISVPAMAAKDTAGNYNIASSMSATVDYNPNAPTVTISQPSGTQTAAFDVTVTFSEAVEGFMAGDISLTGVNASASIGTPTGLIYPVTITPTSDGTLTIFMEAGVVMDAVDMEDDYNVASNEVTVEVDVNRPRVTEIAAPDTHNSGNAFDVTITFSEDVTGFDPSDLTLTLTNATAAISWSSNTARTYTGAITPTIAAGNTGTVTIQVPASVAQDGANRDNTASGTKSVTVDRERPTVDSITAPTTDQSGDFPVTITFSEPVYNFVPSELTVSTGGTAPSSWSSGNNGDTTYTGTINTTNISSTGTVMISVPNNAAEDAAGNGNSVSSSSVDKTVTVDKMKPTPTIAAVSGTKSVGFPITINFDEGVTNFDLNRISVSTQSGDATGTASSFDRVSATQYTVTITPSGTGTLRISVSAGAAEDTAGNESVASMNVDVSVDMSGPTPTITAPTDTQNGEFDVTIDFGENVRDFTRSDVVVRNATKASSWKSQTESLYVLTLTPTIADGSTGTVTIDVNAGVAEDTGSNPNEAASQVTVNIDKDAPTLTIDAPSDPQNGPFDVTFDFDQDVSGFIPNDVTVTNANTASNWKSGATATTYVLRLTPTATAGEEETVTIDVAANKATDAATNGNEAATQASVMVDKKRPTVSISGVPLVSDEKNDVFDLTIMFNEDVSDFTTEDLIVTPTGRATATAVAAVSGSESQYTATIMPNNNQDGNVTVRVRGNAAVDEAGNRSTVSADTSDISIDTVRPTVVIENVPDEAQSKGFDLTVRFNETVNGFDENDVSLLTGPATVGRIETTGSIGGYYVAILPNDAVDGEVTVKINAGVATDTAGNTNTASTTVRFSVDTVAPTAAFSGVPTTPQKDPFTVTLTFDEPVLYFGIPADLKATLNTMTVVLHSGADGDAVYELRVTPHPSIDGSTPESIIIQSFAVEDNAGNENIVEFSTGEIVIDTIVPTVEISGEPEGEQNGVFPLTITFSEDVNGFAAADLMVTGGVATATVAPVGASKMNYIATITPNAVSEGDVTVRVDTEAVTDDAENYSTASAVTSAIHIDTIIPTFTTSGLPSGEQNSAFTLTILFSEGVNGFAADDLNLGGGPASVTKVDSPDDNEYLVTITPTANREGDVTVRVNANAAMDDAGNGNTALTITPAIHVDTIVPTATISGLPTGEENDAFDLTIRFNEDVTGFATDDLTVTGGVATATVAPVGASKMNYIATITPNAISEGDVTVQVRASTVTDDAGNGNTISAVTSGIHVDTIVPTVSISVPPTGEQKDAFPLTITFNEDVNGFAAAALTVTGGVATATVAPVGASKMNYIATITPNAISEGDVTVQVRASTVTDDAGNGNTISAVTSEIHVDTIVPTATISGLPTGEENDAFPLTITFNEDVNGFAAAALTVTGGVATATVAPVGASKMNYIATITPNAISEGDVTVQVRASTVTDDAGNNNTISAVTSEIHVDTIVPTATISGLPDGEENDAFPLTITFNEDVNGFAAAALTVTGGVATATVAPVGASKMNYIATITPNAISEGDVTVQVRASTVTDDAGNGNTISAVTSEIHVDTIVPTATISGLPTGEENDAFPLTITFNEDVTGFAAEDLEVTGEATATAVSAVSGSKSEYTATITPNAISEGDVTVQVRASTVTDDAGNGNTISAVTSEIHVDTIVPTATISGLPTGEENDAFPLTITFNEDVTGFAAEDLEVTGEATATAVSAVSGSKSEYTATITPNPTSEDDVTVQVNANTVIDAAGNPNTASAATPDIHVDTIPPTVSMVVTPPVTIGQETGYPTRERNAPYTLTVTFSEPVNGFAPGDLTVTGSGRATLTVGAAGDSEYTVTITPNANSESDVTVTVNATTVRDFATNRNPAGSSPVRVHIDTRDPTFTIEDTPVLQRRNDPFDIRVVFSEPVNDFRVPQDFTPSDLVTASLQAGADGASEYTVRMTPNEDVQGELIIEINEESVQDFALNLNVNSVATQQPVRIDTIAPTVEITDLPTGVKNEPFDVTITFAEVVNGFTTQDIVLVGPATVALIAGTDGDAIYTARVTPNPNAMGNVTLQIPAAVVLDLAGNANLASLFTPAIASDTNALTVELQNVPETVQLEAFSVMIVFSNDVNGFVLADIEIAGDAVIQSSTLLGAGSAYTLTITPEENTDGDVIITVLAGVAQDAGGRSNAASVPQTIAVAPKWIPDTSLRDAFREQLNLGAGTDFTQQQVRAITTIEAEMSGMTDLTGLEQATALTTLVLPGNEITSITPLQRLTKLTTLNLAGNAITDITPLSGLTALTILNLGSNSLTDISALEDLTNLTALDLSNNALTDISLLENFTQLTTLNLAGNRITDISALTGLTDLTTLSLNDNPISDFTPLTGLTALTTLELGGTVLSSLNVISGLTALTALNLSDNSLTDIALLSKLNGSHGTES